MDNHKRQMRDFRRKKELERKRKARIRIYRNRTILALGAVVILILLILGIRGCSDDQRTNAPAATIVPSMTPSPSLRPTPVLVGGQSEVSNVSEAELEEFYKHSAFVGNSQIEDLESANAVPDADYFYKVGLTVSGALEETMDTSDVPVIDELKNDEYDNIFMMFGENESGWENLGVFKSDYKKLITKAHSYQPNASVYLLSVLPISKEAESKSENGETIENIKRINQVIREIAIANNCGYIDLYSVFAQPDGYLPEGLSSDGVHFDRRNCEKLINAIVEEVNKANGVETGSSAGEEQQDSDSENDETEDLDSGNEEQEKSSKERSRGITVTTVAPSAPKATAK